MMITRLLLPTSLCSRSLLATTLAIGLSAAPVFGHHLEKHFTVTPRPIITVQSSHGKISVKSWKKAEVVVVGDHASPKIEVDTEQAGNRIEVTTRTLSDNLKPAELEANYQITVPEESQLQIKTDSGLIVVERVYGDLVFETVAGELQLEEVGGHMTGAPARTPLGVSGRRSPLCSRRGRNSPPQRCSGS